MKGNKRERGFALGMALVLGLAILIMGLAGAFMSEMGFRSLSAEARWHVVEKAANHGLMKTIEYLRSHQVQCGDKRNYSDYDPSGKIKVEAQTKRGGDMCFIISKAELYEARIVKTAVVPISGDILGALTFRVPQNINLGGSGAIVNCDDKCPGPAILLGSNVTSEISNQTLNQTCPKNPKGALSFTEPIKIDRTINPDEGDFLTSKVFNANNRSELLTLLENSFNIEFNNGTPLGLKNENTCITNQSGNCTAENNRIKCGNTEYIWENNRYRVGNQTCINLDLRNADLTFMQNFSGRGSVAAKNVTIKTNLNDITIVSNEEVKLERNNLELTNVNIFSKKIYIDENNLKWYGGIIYSGGAGVGYLTIDLNSNSKLGTETNPVLIISDNELNVQRNGNAEIYGLIFATDAVKKVNIGPGNGNFKLYGSIVSNAKENSNLNITGNFEIHFNKQVLDILARNYPWLLRAFSCNTLNLKSYFIQSTMMSY